MNLALFDLDHTLLPIDSDYAWGRFLVNCGAIVDTADFEKKNAIWTAYYQAGTLDPNAYLRFVFNTLAQFPRAQLDYWRGQFMTNIIQPHLHPNALRLVAKHQQAGDLVAIATATNRFIAAPIAKCFQIEHLIAAEGEMTADGSFTGELFGTSTFGVDKVTQTLAWLGSLDQSLHNFSRSYFYSDSYNDIPLLSCVTDPVATNPCAVLHAHAISRGWPILHLWHND